MIEEIGSIWDVASRPADAIAVTTNGSIRRDGCGVMGRGCARQAAVLYPTIALNLGVALKSIGNHVAILMPMALPMIVSFPVKHTWSDVADWNLIERSAGELAAKADVLGWTRVVLPRPGCGNGSLDWSDIKPVIAPVLDDRFVVRYMEGFD